MGSLRWRAMLAAAVVLVGLMYVLPSIPAVQNSSLRTFLPAAELNLGLDLKGGIHLTLGVDLDVALSNAMSSLGQDIRTEARDEKIVVLRPRVVRATTLEFVLVHQDQQQKMDDLLRTKFSTVQVQSRENSDGGQVRYTLQPTEDYVRYLQGLTMDQALKTIRSRIDQFGVAEPDIRKQQGNRIIVQLPGLADPKRAVNIIGRTAHLEFKLVDELADVHAAENGTVPAESELAYMNEKGGGTGKIPLVLKKKLC